ncbi:sialate O-acetylesterase [Xylanibacter muris]|uniref:Sialate O-acetylesterase domain-containing protein n=1 Tax=Xylanibacter muris TaxID=2736290 RepID=A0ABX2AQ04_9BACT|nr:sialate O-acetylesterase [Xylanibacter muris]NPD92006.1 hypothetical protein [Xylanibacter muris]
MTIKRILYTAIALIIGGNAVSAQKPADVFIYAGQSNADGRVYNSELPVYLKQGYDCLHFANVTSSSDGKFGTRTFENRSGRWAFCDVTNYFIEQALKEDFYALKCTYGGTAIDTAATYAHLPVWCADEKWIAKNNAYRGNIDEGRSLTKSLTEGLADCADVTLCRLDKGYDVKAIMWHQGESDRSKAGNYYKNFKDMINYMRNAVYQITGREKDKTLPFIFGTVSRNSKQYSSGVEEAQKRVAAELPNVYYIDMSDAGLRSDALHFDSAWTEYLGKKMYNMLVAHEIIDGQELEVEKPHIPSASDTLKVEAERSWMFTEEWESEAVSALETDADWPMFQKLGHRYSKSMSVEQELAASGNYIFPKTKGLFFKCSSGNRIIINPGKYLCFYGDNLYMKVPKVSPGQTVTIVTESAKGERGLTTDSGEYLELVSGGIKSTGKVTNVWRVKESLKEPVDLIFHSNGGAIYVYSIEITSPYVQILVGADGKVMFSSDKACCIKPYSDLVKAYVAVGYDEKNDVLALEQTDTIPANTGVLLIGEECMIGAPEIKTDTVIGRNLFVAVPGEKEIPAVEIRDGIAYCNYVLRTVDGVSDFHKLKSVYTLEGQAYLQMPETDRDVIKIDDGITGMTFIVGENFKTGRWYDITGKEVSRPSKGLFINGGRKYLFK